MNNAENLPTDNNNKSIVKGHTMYNWETHDDQDKVVHGGVDAVVGADEEGSSNATIDKSVGVSTTVSTQSTEKRNI